MIIKRYLPKSSPKFSTCFSRKLISQLFFEDTQYSLASVRNLNNLAEPLVHQFIVDTTERKVPVTITESEFDNLKAGTISRLHKITFEVNLSTDTTNPIVFGKIQEYYTFSPSLIVLELEFETETSLNSFQLPDWVGDDVTNNLKFSEMNLALRQ